MKNIIWSTPPYLGEPFSSVEKRFNTLLENYTPTDPKGIGTLNEKSTHNLLKNLYAPSTNSQEIRKGRFVADIAFEEQIIEIQSRHFHTLRKKLDAFLPLYNVTIVHPIYCTKWIQWIDTETGELSVKRKSPKKETLFHVLLELYSLKAYLDHPNLHFIIPLLEAREYKLLNGYGSQKKKRAVKQDTLPTALIDVVYLTNTLDYKQFLPPSLPKPFTSNDYKQATKIPMRYATVGLNLLTHLGIVNRVGKKGNAFLYEVNTSLNV